MKKTIKRTMYYPSFNEEQNNFDYNEMEYSRPMTPYELKWHRVYSIFWWVGIIIFVVSLITTAICLEINRETLIGWVSLSIMLDSCIIMLIVGRLVVTKYNSVMLNAQDIGFNDEILRWEQITQEQNEIAEKWRAEHPP